MPPARPTSAAPAHASRLRWLTWPYRLLMLLGACAGFVAIWVVLAWSRADQCGWMALLGALDAAWILRLAGWPAGPRRAVAGVIATAAIIVAANWWIIAVNLGAMLGFAPWESAVRLGVQHAWVLAQLANTPFDVAMMFAALALAAIASR